VDPIQTRTDIIGRGHAGNVRRTEIAGKKDGAEILNQSRQNVHRGHGDLSMFAQTGLAVRILFTQGLDNGIKIVGNLISGHVREILEILEILEI
jgi:hypothetical protein